MKRMLLLVLLWLPAATFGQIYKSVDANGNPVFSDTPPAQGTAVEEVQLKTINSAVPPPFVPAIEPDKPEQAVQQYRVKIRSPADETSIPMGPGNFTVSASLEPSHPGKARLQLFIDGAAWQQPQSSGTWELTNIFRGAHDLTVDLVDQSGATLASSDPIRVYIHRPSVNFKNRQ